MSTPVILNRDQISTIALLLLLAAGIVGCIVLAAPFLPALTWALALAVIANPLHDWVLERTAHPGWAASITVFILTVILLAPFVLLGQQIGRQASESYEEMQQATQSGNWLEAMRQNPYLAPVASWLQVNFDPATELQRVGAALQRQAGGLVSYTVWTIIQFLMTLFLLFYLFRDQKQAMRSLRSLLPLSDGEADRVLEQVRAITHATLYGTLVVSAIQGTLGGLMFWILGLPAPLLWGSGMALMSIIPVLGAFTIWGPAAVFLALQGEPGKAAILAGWGVVVVGTIDNILYPMLVGKEMRLHTVPVFVAVVGGLAVFGAAGLVLGPVVLALTLALIDVLRQRTKGNRSAQRPT